MSTTGVTRRGLAAMRFPPETIDFTIAFVSSLKVHLVFGGLASLAFFAANSDAKPETVTKITDGVWFREGDLKNLGHCNNIIIEMKDYLIVVDANFPSGAKATMEDAKKVSSKPVKYV